MLTTAALLLAALLLAPPTPAPRPPVKASLPELAWLAGRWVGGEAGARSEEIWTEPDGDSMIGMWRYVQGGQARIFELLVLKAEEGSVVLRLRHFDPKLVGREDKDRAVEFALVSLKPREAVFEGTDYAGRGMLRLSYRRPTDDTLVGVLEKEGTRQEFSFKLQP